MELLENVRMFCEKQWREFIRFSSKPNKDLVLYSYHDIIFYSVYLETNGGYSIIILV